MARNYNTGENVQLSQRGPAGDTAEPAVRTGQPRLHVPPAPIAMPRDGRRIRILERGWETFTGDFGSVLFKDGVSIELLPEVFIDRVATQLRTIDVDTGLQVGPQQRHLDSMAVRMTVVEPSKGPVNRMGLAKADQVAIAVENGQEEKASVKLYTEDELYKIAESGGVDGGIIGLRKIGAEYGVKARALTDLIVSILRAQAAAIENTPKA